MKKYILIFLLSVSSLSADAPLSWLSAKNKEIVNDKGQSITLRGVNLGSWFVEELWMLPITQDPPKNSPYTIIQDHVSLWKTFEKRFGKEKMEQIKHHYRLCWIHDIDFANIKAAGFNTVRLPFLYDLQHETTGLFYWLDHAVELAKRHGLYIILDMHGVPGRQSNSMHTGEVDKGEFFSEQSHIDKTCAIWKEIAKHYKDCPQIAGYDLINEPMNAPGPKELFKMYDKIYKAVRSEDKRHLIFLEDGYKGLSHIPHPKDYKWENVVLSTHHYVFEENTADEHINKLNEHIKKVDAAIKKANIPFYLGEFNVAPKGSFETIKRVMKILHDKKISYSFWSYKIGRRGHKNSLWALYHAPGNQKNIDPFKDSYKDIIKKIERLKSKNYDKNSELIALFKG